MQEWPAHLASTALDEDNGPATDAVVFVVDAASASSIAYLLRWVDAVPDGVPTTVVATLHESRGKDANAAGLELLAKLCSDAPAVSLLTAAGAPAAVAPDASGAGEPLPASVVGLSLQLFRFVLRVRPRGTRLLRRLNTRAPSGCRLATPVIYTYARALQCRHHRPPHPPIVRANAGARRCHARTAQVRHASLRGPAAGQPRDAPAPAGGAVAAA